MPLTSFPIWSIWDSPPARRIRWGLRQGGSSIRRPRCWYFHIGGDVALFDTDAESPHLISTDIARSPMRRTTLLVFIYWAAIAPLISVGFPRSDRRRAALSVESLVYLRRIRPLSESRRRDLRIRSSGWILLALACRRKGDFI